MKIALVHDYIKEYGGAERVLEALCELYPDAPIYTAFFKTESNAYQKFKDKKIIASWAQNVPFFATKLHSPLRFLAPLIWGSFDFSKYDVVISSASWYVTKGVVKRQTTKDKRPIEICYCHTPPRWLYGYKTAVEYQKYWPIKVYAAIIGHFMRLYDYSRAQRVDFFIANSKEVAGRIKKFYRREAEVIYPPVSLQSTGHSLQQNEKSVVGSRLPVDEYYFIVARLVGPKGIDIAIDASKKGNFHLKIAGVSSGYGFTQEALKKNAGSSVEFLGHVSDGELVHLYTNAKAFLALGTDEDFGITPVEAMLCGTPVIAYKGGGYLETVIDKKTGVFFNESTSESLLAAMKQLNALPISSKDCIAQAEKFSKERFKKEVAQFVDKHTTRV